MDKKRKDGFYLGLENVECIYIPEKYINAWDLDGVRDSKVIPGDKIADYMYLVVDESFVEVEGVDPYLRDNYGESMKGWGYEQLKNRMDVVDISIVKGGIARTFTLKYEDEVSGMIGTTNTNHHIFKLENNGVMVVVADKHMLVEKELEIEVIKDVHGSNSLI